MNSLIGKALKESKKTVKEDLIDDTRVMEKDHEVNMAKSQLYKTAKYAIELHNLLNKVTAVSYTHLTLPTSSVV